MTLLAEISNEIADKGEWNGNRADSIRTAIADWAFAQNLAKIRKNVERWGLSDSVAHFEKYINNFIAEIYGIKVCSEVSTEAQMVANENSQFYGRTYQCYKGTEGNPLNEVTWVDVRPKSEYLNPELEYETMIDWRDRRMYYVRHEQGSYLRYDSPEPDENTVVTSTRFDETYMAENLDFEYRVNGEVYGTFCHTEKCDSEESRLIGRHYTWAAAMDSAGVYSDNGKGCGFKSSCSESIPTRGICPEGWHIADSQDWANLIEYAGYKMGKKDPATALFSKKSSSGTKKGLDEIGFSAIVTTEWYDQYMSINNTYYLSSESGLAAFWSPDELSEEQAGMVRVGHTIYGYDAIGASSAYLTKTSNNVVKTSRINIRCFKDK